MKAVTVTGGRPLFGRVSVSGSKNAALPILFAAMTVGGTSRITALPRIGDTIAAAEILRCFGALADISDEVAVVSAETLRYTEPPADLTSGIRASTYLIGACLGRFGRCRLPHIGGCGFSARPIDIHIDAAESFGARLFGDELICDGLRGTDVHLRLPSVGATVNSLLMAVRAEGESRIFGYAREPHVMALVEFLRSAGADIAVTEKCIFVSPTVLHGAEFHIIGDMIEAGTYLAAGLITHGEVCACGSPVGDMDAYFSLLEALGADISVAGSDVTVRMARAPRRVCVTAEPYPGFPTDLQPIAAALAATSLGAEIRDEVFPGRFGYLDALRPLGVRSHGFSGGAIVFPSEIFPAELTSPDLRGGAAALLLALSADGVSRINNAQLIMRGYENFDNKLCALGAELAIN